MKSDIEKVRELGQAIGYGNMMDLACKLWRIKLRESGFPESGAFIPVLSMDIKESETDFYLKGLKNHEENILRILNEDKKPSIPEYLLNQPKKVELSGDEYESIFMKFEGKEPIENASSLHISHHIHIDENGVKYHFYYPIDTTHGDQPLIEKEINDTNSNIEKNLRN